MKDDSIDGHLRHAEKLRADFADRRRHWPGGDNVRATGSYIKGTNGNSNGLVPMLKVFNDTARYVDQGGGKRKGAFAIYLEPWHADIFDFLDLKKNHGKEEMRARDLFYALWTPDLFMKRVEENGDWTLMCPHECPGLGRHLGRGVREAVHASTSAKAAAAEPSRRRSCGLPSWKARPRPARPTCCSRTRPTASRTSRTWAPSSRSNLCTEIMEYTDERRNCGVQPGLAGAAPLLVTDEGGQQPAFDHQKLYEVTYQATMNLNKVIDVNYYPVPETQSVATSATAPSGWACKGWPIRLLPCACPSRATKPRA